MPAAREVLCRTQAAVDTVLGWATHVRDLVDQRDLVTLHALEWELACTLAEYSRLARERAPGGAEPVSDTGRADLEAALCACERKAGVLEGYVEAVVRIRRAPPVKNAARLAYEQDLAALLARASVDDTDTDRVRAMTDRAAALLESTSGDARHGAI